MIPMSTICRRYPCRRQRLFPGVLRLCDVFECFHFAFGAEERLQEAAAVLRGGYLSGILLRRLYQIGNGLLSINPAGADRRAAAFHHAGSVCGSLRGSCGRQKHRLVYTYLLYGLCRIFSDHVLGRRGDRQALLRTRGIFLCRSESADRLYRGGVRERPHCLS